MKKTIRDLDLDNKKVIIRVDFNVPIKDDFITDDNRIRMSLKTINYAIEHNAKIILMSHLGRIKSEEDKQKNSLRVVATRLSELLNKKVIFVNETRGKKLEKSILDLKPGEVLLMENTRFEDLDNKKESKNDLELGRYWASLGEIFINDAFGTAHREHASNVGIARNLENAIGFLIEEELSNLNNVLKNPSKPFTLILGGAKVQDKIGLIENLIEKVDYILIGGGMAYTFLKAKGYNIGKSLLDSDSIEFCKKILEKYNNKIILPIDTVAGNEISENATTNEYDIDNFNNNDIGLDIGRKTIELFSKYLNESKTIFWNGPLGAFEIEKFSNGTKEVLKILSNLKSNVIIGGGDTASAAINFGYKDSFTHISTGGGASLELLEGKNLPGIDIISEK